jgi:hypothetical protein
MFSVNPGQDSAPSRILIVPVSDFILLSYLLIMYQLFFLKQKKQLSNTAGSYLERPSIQNGDKLKGAGVTMGQTFQWPPNESFKVKKLMGEILDFLHPTLTSTSRG